MSATIIGIRICNACVCVCRFVGVARKTNETWNYMNRCLLLLWLWTSIFTSNGLAGRLQFRAISPATNAYNSGALKFNSNNNKINFTIAIKIGRVCLQTYRERLASASLNVCKSESIVDTYVALPCKWWCSVFCAWWWWWLWWLWWWWWLAVGEPGPTMLLLCWLCNGFACCVLPYKCCGETRVTCIIPDGGDDLPAKYASKSSRRM